MAVAAVVVTYRRPELLARACERLLAEAAVDRVIVVDNGAGAWQAPWLADPKVVYLAPLGNAGGAGGFDLGLALAFARGADWAWLQDDDGWCEPGAVGRALDAAERGGFSVVNALVTAPDGDQLAFGLPDGRGGTLATVAEAAAAAGGRDVLEDAMNPFNGTLVSRAAYERIGRVKTEMFIWGDEADYERRIAAAGLRYGTALHARVVHPPGASRGAVGVRTGERIDLSPKRRRMLVRNRCYARSRGRGGLAGAVRFLARYLRDAEPAPDEALRLVLYGLDGALDLFRLHPSRRLLRRAIDAFVTSD